MQTKRQLKRCTRNVHPSFADFRPGLCKFSYFTNTELTLGVKFIFIISLMHTLSDKVRFVQRKLKVKPEEAFTTKKWMVLAEHLLAQAHIIKLISCSVLQFPFQWSCVSMTANAMLCGCDRCLKLKHI